MTNTRIKVLKLERAFQDTNRHFLSLLSYGPIYITIFTSTSITFTISCMGLKILETVEIYLSSKIRSLDCGFEVLNRLHTHHRLHGCGIHISHNSSPWFKITYY